ncbi:hypothetical protein [Salinarimonas ramus]|uniref:Permease n=1 Tax=Salinarimonas ramus TaxID=690164 RepID=A0A917Q631_9HYPH|nr:hypothetical protein [Salinarimonas ramus]GGK20892.1 hypothetical protein GCM10011322_04410 [Salinarimonas ramus]
MIAGVVGLLSLAALVALVTGLKRPSSVVPAARFVASQGSALALRLPVALVAAGFLGLLVPQSLVAGSLGAETGLSGILLASLVGCFLPGGPTVTFPLALVFWNAGAGAPQMVALLTAWSVFAFHRLMAFELPIMGWRFTAIRLIASAALPTLAGLAAGALVAFTGVEIGR